MPNAYIIDGIRTPIGSFAGSLAPIRADDLAAHVLHHLMTRNTWLPPSSIADVIMGCANQAGEDNRNVARMALLLAKLPYTVPGETVNRLCASGMAAVVQAARGIIAQDGDFFIAGGVEQMTRGPWVISKTSTPFGRDSEMHDSSFGWRFINPAMKSLYGVDSMGQTAENLQAQTQISRTDQDSFALWSQQKANIAQKNGRLALEITPIPIPQRKGEPILFSTDEFVKPETTLEGLAKLRPAFNPQGSVTAGNASGLNDGAAALLLASDEGVAKYGLKPLAKVRAMGVAGVEPRIMGIGPVYASQIALAKAGLSLADMDIIELNEAFAVQALACTRQWGIADNDPRLNPNGGAIALGHPLGMSGARLVLTAALSLQQGQGKFALCTMCIGVGQGYAVILERIT
ncbi:MAG: 3-oxoadipyl-CoA thiolase [Sphingobacteriales bacterium]|jgi:acetyl-CoA acyltransferase|nr:3-oxoadipyl-CoA thiolase [Sphingobacteriales bacterium]MBP9140104.1 3-oxoadipyl-CoA thiolase [Chitinophagales bacterium]MDA0198218.1 3-oxoadipyl-CoA thiolase [Bacteroidota bacterium]MBK6889965.1 3-oxoadipyl-CoA thiolase [Sphingobacteriales bacterium]MBK7527511.1 3-oxoadipyl-CoA thiolase [Sphingobacteriales bacterium]